MFGDQLNLSTKVQKGVNLVLLSLIPRKSALGHVWTGRKIKSQQAFGARQSKQKPNEDATVARLDISTDSLSVVFITKC